MAPRPTLLASVFALRLGLGLGLGAAVCATGVARAEETPNFHCSIRMIEAVPPGAKAVDGKPAEPKIDPRIDKLRPFLTKPPFTAWNEFVLLDKQRFEMKPKEPHAFTLPNGKPASLTMVDHLPHEEGQPHRVRIQLQIGEPAHPSLNTVFVVTEGNFVLQAGERYKNGIMILGTGCWQSH